MIRDSLLPFSCVTISTGFLSSFFFSFEAMKNDYCSMSAHKYLFCMQIKIMTNNEQNVCYFHLEAKEKFERENKRKKMNY